MNDHDAAGTLHARLHWRELAQPRPLVLGRAHRVTIEPEVVPIVFVPGIMGTKLRDAAGSIWDPDDTFNFVLNFGVRFSGMAARLRALVGGENHVPNHLWVKDRSVLNSADDSFKNLVHAGYGTLLPALKSAPHSAAMKLCLKMPVHAFAYNWTQSVAQSGLALRRFIAQLIDRYNGAHECRQVMIVTHSMGGLVARAAMGMHGALPLVTGAVHVMMPTAGAPSMYVKMKLGFAPQPTGRAPDATDIMFGALMGPTGRGVARVLGHLPGALGLLPSHLYRIGR